MSSFAIRSAKLLRLSVSTTRNSSLVAAGVQRTSKMWYSTGSLDDFENEEAKNEEIDEILGDKPNRREPLPQGVRPGKGWNFRGVHKIWIEDMILLRTHLGVEHNHVGHVLVSDTQIGVTQAIICGKVGQAPVQKILRNGRTITIFTVGTGGMFDLRVVRDQNTPKPVQWHRIAVHNDILGAYAVQKVTKNSQVFVEGDIETRVYNDSINGEVKHVPEICIRRDGRIRVIKPGTGVNNISFDDLSKGLV